MKNPKKLNGLMGDLDAVSANVPMTAASPSTPATTRKKAKRNFTLECYRFESLQRSDTTETALTHWGSLLNVKHGGEASE